MICQDGGGLQVWCGTVSLTQSEGNNRVVLIVFYQCVPLDGKNPVTFTNMQCGVHSVGRGVLRCDLARRPWTTGPT